jgi:membrane protein YdbS with pleckstrin-like domain
VPFPERLLGENEEIVYDLRPHWWALVGPVLLTLLVLAAASVGWALLPGGQLHWPSRFAATGVALLVLLIFVLPPYLRWVTTHFVLTTDRLIFRSGVLAKLSREIPLERLNDVTFTQSLWERLIGAGDLLIESAGERGQSVLAKYGYTLEWHNVPHPEAVQMEIYHQMEANGLRMSGGGARPPSTMDDLERLARLRDRGHITEDEFQQKKRDLLDRL